MNPTETHELTELIGRLRTDGGYTVLVIEHDMHVVEGISDRVIALDHGVKIAEGSFDAGRDERPRDRGVSRTAGGGDEMKRCCRLRDVDTYYGEIHILQQARRSRSARASSSACSAATPRASRRR